jgi:hypothetical protein
MLCFLFLSALSVHAEQVKCGADGKAHHRDTPCGVSGDEQPAPAMALQIGLAAFEKGEYGFAFQLLDPLVTGGNAMAQNTVGRMYLFGLGVPVDQGKALALFRMAASQGLPNAINNLGVVYAEGKIVPQDYQQAIVWFRKAAEQGYSLAMDNLADMYEQGLGVYPNFTEADMWRKKSQSIRHMERATSSSLVKIRTVGADEYEKGLSRYYRWDFAGAARWLKIASTKGHPEAQLKLALLYEQGQGVRRNKRKAQYWYETAKKGCHTTNDDRDRVIVIDASKAPPPRPAPVIVFQPAISHSPVPYRDGCGSPIGSPIDTGRKCSEVPAGCPCIRD